MLYNVYININYSIIYYTLKCLELWQNIQSNLTEKLKNKYLYLKFQLN